MYTYMKERAIKCTEFIIATKFVCREAANEVSYGFGSVNPTYINSILRIKGRTIIIVNYIDRLLGHYKLTAVASGDEELRRFNV